MTTTLNEELLATSVGVLEDLCFVCPDPTDGSTPKAGDGITVQVGFRGPAKGRLALRFVGVPQQDIAAAMLGDDDTVLSTAETRDAIGEVANVICGQLLPRIAGDTAVFDLDPPCFPETDGKDFDGFVALAALGGRIEIAFRVDQGTIAGVTR